MRAITPEPKMWQLSFDFIINVNANSLNNRMTRLKRE